MLVMVMNKETNEEIIYNNVEGYDTHGAISNGNSFEAVFQLILKDGNTATFHKADWDLFVLKNVR